MFHCAAGLVVEDDQAPVFGGDLFQGGGDPAFGVAPVAGDGVPQDGAEAAGDEAFDYGGVEEVAAEFAGSAVGAEEAGALVEPGQGFFGLVEFAEGGGAVEFA